MCLISVVCCWEIQILDETKILVRPYVRNSKPKPPIFMKLTKLKTVGRPGVTDDAFNIQVKKPEETKRILIVLWGKSY